MSQQNVEIARRANAAFNDADFSEFAEYLHPDITFTDQANAADVAATSAVAVGLALRRVGDR